MQAFFDEMNLVEQNKADIRHTKENRRNFGKASMIKCFDHLAPTWDAHEVRNESSLSRILDYADIRAGVSVLDVACGTGVLIPDYLKRDVARITGVNVSPAMIACAKAKLSSPRVTLLAADMEETGFSVPAGFSIENAHLRRAIQRLGAQREPEDAADDAEHAADGKIQE